MKEEDKDWERAHLRVEGNEWRREMNARRDRTCKWKGLSGGRRCRLGESALDRARGVEEVIDWERAHLRVGVVWCRGGRHLLGEGALESGISVEERDADWERAHLRVKWNDWRRETPTGRERP